MVLYMSTSRIQISSKLSKVSLLVTSYAETEKIKVNLKNPGHDILPICRASVFA